jgi:RNA polymerase sigma factor (sigma-70 family)
VTTAPGTEDLLRRITPQALGAVVRRFGDFAASEDVVQEALLAAATQWPRDGVPENPVGWLIRVATRRMADRLRSDQARRHREDVVAAWAAVAPDPLPGDDDTLALMFMCCHPALTPASAIPLTLRAVGGLTTAEIARAFLVPEPTMAQRISRAKARIKASGAVFAMPQGDERPERLRSVLHVLYLLFNEGYVTSAGPDLARSDLAHDAIRLTRAVREGLPQDPEVAGLLALMLLTDARRAARTGPVGELIPLAEQDRSRWDRCLIAEGVALVTEALERGHAGEYQVQAAIAALHDEAPTAEHTDWAEILALYGLLERMTGNPMVTLNRAVAAAMVVGPAAGLEVLDGVSEHLAGHHRLDAVRAHLFEMAGDRSAAIAHFRAAAAGTASLPERHYLTAQAARLAAAGGPSALAP